MFVSRTPQGMMWLYQPSVRFVSCTAQTTARHQTVFLCLATILSASTTLWMGQATISVSHGGMILVRVDKLLPYMVRVLNSLCYRNVVYIRKISCTSPVIFKWFSGLIISNLLTHSLISSFVERVACYAFQGMLVNLLHLTYLYLD